MPQRDFYIDRLRTVLTALVVLHHTAITYGSNGGWFWHEIAPSGTPSSLVLSLFCGTNQAYFMGFFFLLAGYFTPPSLERKGYGRFLADRFLRLGLPLLAFGLFLGPLTAAMVNCAQGHGFWSAYVWLWQHKMFINGPLWFAQALLIFALGYCAWRAIFGRSLQQAERAPKPVPASRWWLLSAVGVAAAALTIRQFVPPGQNVFGLQLGYFASYIFLFALGIAAWRHDWLRQLSWKNARPWLITLVLAWPCLPVGSALAQSAGSRGDAHILGGLTWPAILYGCWEPFVAWGLIAALLLIFREHLNQPSGVWSWLGRRAFTVYIIHPVVLVGLSLLLRGWVAPALVKFCVVGSLACIACWLAADPLVRLPGVRRVI
jgi:fucose 4-O-acetylase-like acetyltransferase